MEVMESTSRGGGWTEALHRTWRAVPIVTKIILLSMCVELVGCQWVLGWNSVRYLGNVPYLTVFHVQVYRIFLSMFAVNGLFDWILSSLIMFSVGMKLERQLGSVSFLTTIIAMGALINTIICIIAFLALINPFLPFAVWMYEPCHGFGIVLFALIVIDCNQSPDATQRMALFQVEVKAKYIPWIFFVISFILFGPTLSLSVSMLVGYLYAFKACGLSAISSHRIDEMESHCFPCCSSSWGFIRRSEADGFSILPSTAAPSATFLNSSSSPFVMPGTVPPPHAFPGQGHVLGTNDGVVVHSHVAMPTAKRELLANKAEGW